MVAISIACLGLLGLVSFTTQQRTKEIGVRKILGASVSQVLFLLSKEFILMVLLANLIAWPVGYVVMEGWLQDFTYRIDLPLSVFIMSTVLALAIAWMAVCVQTMKAARANPSDALRYE